MILYTDFARDYDLSKRKGYYMSKNIRLFSFAVSLIMIVCCFTSCLFGAAQKSDYLSKGEVQQMINNSMHGNITVEGGDNYNVTIDSANQDNVAAGKALLSVVSIDCIFKTVGGYGTQKEKSSSGSGVIYKIDKNRGDAYIITNYHVVYYNASNTENKISDDITLYLYGQESTEYAIPASYVGGSMNYDIAVLKVSGSRVLAQSNAMAAEFADSNMVAVLDKAIAIGNPENLGISATLGYVNVDSEYIRMEGADGSTEIQLRVMRMDTAVNSGNSGGGLFDNEGRLIGIVNAKLTSSENMSYAIPSNFVKYVADNILFYCDNQTRENVYRCYLGIVVSPEKLYTEYDKNNGKVIKREVVSITSLNDDSIVKDALEIGDVINSITIDGVKYDVTRMFVVTDAMLNARAGSSVVINITRGGNTFDVSINVTENSITKIV